MPAKRAHQGPSLVYLLTVAEVNGQLALSYLGEPLELDQARQALLRINDALQQARRLVG